MNTPDWLRGAANQGQSDFIMEMRIKDTGEKKRAIIRA